MTTTLQLRSLITADGQLELALHERPLPAPADDEVLIRVEATPINPSDIGLLFGAADLATVEVGGTPERPQVRARVPAPALAAMAGRAGQALLGHRVATMGGAMYAQHRVAKAEACLLLPEGASAEQGASCFINPLTALGFVQTMRHEGHAAIVHTAAASNLGQMLNRIALADGFGLVSIVRSPAQVALLKAQGAQHVVDRSAPDYAQRLAEAVAATGATLGFDAAGGGTLAAEILAAMEAALLRKAGAPYSRYGSDVHKQVYLYGSLDTGPTEIRRSFGFAWGIGGWLVFPYLAKLGPQVLASLKQRVAAELTTTFASHYSHRVSLAEALGAAAIAGYTRRATGDKYLITP